MTTIVYISGTPKIDIVQSNIVIHKAQYFVALHQHGASGRKQQRTVTGSSADVGMSCMRNRAHHTIGNGTIILVYSSETVASLSHVTYPRKYE